MVSLIMKGKPVPAPTDELRRIAALLTTFLLLLAGAPSHGADAPEIALTAKAEETLDQWRGQRELLDQAAENLYRALSANPRYAKAYVQVGRLHIMGGFYQSRYFEPSSLTTAEKAILKAIEIDPNLADAYVLLGHLYMNMKRPAKSREALRTAERLGTSSPWLPINWALLLETEGKPDEAAAKYLQVIESGTTNLKALSSAYGQLQTYYIDKGELARAEEIYLAHVKADPRSAWTHGNYASDLLFKVGDYDRAIEKAREALAIMDYGYARETLALALYAKWATMVVKHHDANGGQKYFEQAQRIYPSLAWVRQESRCCPTLRIILEALATTGR